MSAHFIVKTLLVTTLCLSLACILSADVSAQGPGYAFCAKENEYCSFSGTKDIAYGANGVFTYQYGLSGGVNCNNDVFGDPISGYGKSCFIKDSSSQSSGGGVPSSGGGNPVGPGGFTFCAKENEYCSFSGTKDVAYGANGVFTYQYGLSDGVNCSNDVFGDPISGWGKSCFITDSKNPSSTGGQSAYEFDAQVFTDQALTPVGYRHFRECGSGRVIDFIQTQFASRFTPGRYYHVKGAGPSQYPNTLWSIESDWEISSCPSAPVESALPMNYSFCAKENEYCSFSGTKDVAYGANGVFTYRYGVSGGIDCNNDIFGDPISGWGKSCFITDSIGPTYLEPGTSHGPYCNLREVREENSGYAIYLDHYRVVQLKSVSSATGQVITPAYLAVFVGITQWEASLILAALKLESGALLSPDDYDCGIIIHQVRWGGPDFYRSEAQAQY